MGRFFPQPVEFASMIFIYFRKKSRIHCNLFFIKFVYLFWISYIFGDLTGLVANKVGISVLLNLSACGYGSLSLAQDTRWGCTDITVVVERDIKP